MSDNAHFAALGDYRFILDKNTYDSLQRSIKHRWEKTDIINNRPNYQLAGTDEETITITGIVFNYRANQGRFDSPVTETGTDQLEQLRQLAATAEPLRFALNDGRYLGYWVLKSVSEQQSNLIGVAAIKQAYTLQLAYFGRTL